jgi:hypothetical protein
VQNRAIRAKPCKTVQNRAKPCKTVQIVLNSPKPCKTGLLRDVAEASTFYAWPILLQKSVGKTHQIAVLIRVTRFSPLGRLFPFDSFLITKEAQILGLIFSAVKGLF